MTAAAVVGVLALGGVGAVLRFLMDGSVSRRAPAALPVGTLSVNLLGAVLLGLLSALALPDDIALVVGTGLLGAFTTFSTWMLETHRLAEERQLRTATLNIVGSVVAGVLAAGAGVWMGGLV